MKQLLSEKDAYINEVLFYIENKTLKIENFTYVKEKLENFKRNDIYHINKNIYQFCKKIQLSVFTDMIYIKDAFRILGVNENFLIKQAKNYFDFYIPNVYKNGSSIMQMRHVHLYNDKIAEKLKEKNKILNFIGIAQTENAFSIKTELIYYDDILIIPSKRSKRNAFFGIYSI